MTATISTASNGPATRRLITRDAGFAAQSLADGAIVAHGFANFYAITSRSDAGTVRRVNLLKGRPPGQVGSITGPPSAIPEAWDFDQLPEGLTRREVLRLIDTFLVLGPFGFRGPAASHVPHHLTFPDLGITTAQVIAPGYSCPSNDFLRRSLRATGDPMLYITSANRSRHLTGADDSPAHWTTAGLQAEFGDEPDLLVVEHPDEEAARGGLPRLSTDVHDDPRPASGHLGAR